MSIDQQKDQVDQQTTGDNLEITPLEIVIPIMMMLMVLLLLRRHLDATIITIVVIVATTNNDRGQQHQIGIAAPECNM